MLRHACVAIQMLNKKIVNFLSDKISTLVEENGGFG